MRENPHTSHSDPHMTDLKIQAARAAMQEAIQRGIIESKSLPEDEYLKHWADWTAIAEAAITAAGFTPPWEVRK